MMSSHNQLATIYHHFSHLAEEILLLASKATTDNDIRNQLEEYDIMLDDVVQNIEASLQIIKEQFMSKPVSSLMAVSSIVTTLQRKIAENKETTEQSSSKRATVLLSFEVNLKYIIEMLKYIWKYEDDIAAFPNFDNARYQAVYKKITVVNDPTPEKSKDQEKMLAKLMTITNAAVIRQLNQTNSVFGLITFGISFPRFAVGYEAAELTNAAFLRNPSIDVLSSIWNLPERGAISRLKYLQFSWIKTNRLIYLPKIRQPEGNIFQESPNSIPVRLLYDDDISFWSEKSTCGCICDPGPFKEINEIIIHFHGGGFVSLSSCTTQSYTRRWAKSLNIPVLSVDYSMPPENRFPAAVEDVLAAYRFIVTKLPQLCNITPKKIILAGDSAGGNLVCSLMGMILREKLQIPTGIFLAYPASSLQMSFSPSRIHSFFTPILHPSLLYLCLKEYLGAEYQQTQNHPLASPLYLSNDFVGERRGDFRFPTRWPRTRIMVGDQDPLFDDSLRLCQRMVQSGIDVSCRVYRNLSHGFLNLEKVVARGEEAIVDSITLIQDCLK